MEVKVRSKGDGLYSCSYLPASPMKHTLAITWGGVGIPNSPFRVSSQSQHLVTAGAPGGAPAGATQDFQSEFLFKAERIEIVQSDSTNSVQAATKDVGKKTKKPLIIIMTYTEEKYIF